MRIDHLSLLAGACPLVPVPFLDRWLHRKVMARMYAEVGVDDASELVRRKDSLVGRVFLSIVWWPIRKLFRTVFFFLTIKECLDTVADAALRAAMVRSAVPLEDPVRVRELLDEATVMSSPVERMYKDLPSAPPVGIPRTDVLARFVRWLQGHGGGAMVVAEFERRLAAQE